VPGLQGDRDARRWLLGEVMLAFVNPNSAWQVSLVTALMVGALQVLGLLLGFWLRRSRQVAEAERLMEELRAQVKKDAYGQALQVYQDSLQDKDRTVNLKNGVIEQQTEAIDLLRRDNTLCQEERAAQRSAIHFIYSQLCETVKKAGRIGLDLGTVPELPDFRAAPVPGPESADFKVRQAQTAKELVKELERDKNGGVSGDPVG
jgi:hypothetical protein